MADTSLIIAVLILQSSFLYFSTSVNQEHPAFELTEHTLVFQTRHSLPMLRWLMATLTNAHTCTSTLSTGPWLSQPPWKAWSSKSALVKWSKRGITTVFIPGHDPPLDITVFKDVSTNPGPRIEPAKDKAVNMVNMDNSGNKNPNSTWPIFSYAYTREQLITLRSPPYQLEPSVYQAIKSHGLFRFRGKRGGKCNKMGNSDKCKYRKTCDSSIQVVTGRRPLSKYCVPRLRLPSVLKYLQRNRGESIPSDHQGVNNKNSSILPRFVLTNACSVLNKLDELQLLLTAKQADVAVVTESWITPNTAPEQYHVEGYNVFSKCRRDRNGGGVLLYVKQHLQATPADDIVVPLAVEGEWVYIHHPRFPRSIPTIAIFSVYIPPNSPHEALIQQHIISTMDSLWTRKPSIGIVLLGDFNRFNIRPICNGNNLVQVVSEPTRRDAILDLIVTNFADQYQCPIVTSPIGRSDHNCVVWSPKQSSGGNQHHKKVIRPMKDSNIRSFGRWIQEQTWNEVLEPEHCQAKVDAFYEVISRAIEYHFPLRIVKRQNSDKPWVTDHIKHLVAARQNAFASGNKIRFRSLRNKVIREITSAKQSYYAGRIRDMQKTNPGKWHREIRNLANCKKEDLTLHVPDHDSSNFKLIANVINNYFAGFSQAQVPLNFDTLPAYLPSPSPAPQVQPWTVYKELRRTSVTKSGGPDDLPARIIKEFAYELSFPVTNILNTSFSQAIVPTQWKEANVVPIPKQFPPKLQKLRPISLTPLLAKIAEGFICKWVTNAIQPNIDVRQFGNQKGLSTTHCLVDILHQFVSGTNPSSSIGTLIVTDFTKAFDSVNHEVAIKNLLDLGAPPATVQWIVNFLTKRKQRVKYKQNFSDWQTLSCGVPQGTKLGPVIFLACINNAASSTRGSCWKYVDDLTLGECRHFNGVSHLQEDLNGPWKITSL